MHVRTMNEIEDCPTVTLKITYPDGYPQNENLLIEFDYEEEEPDIDDDDLKDLRICLENTVSEPFRTTTYSYFSNNRVGYKPTERNRYIDKKNS